MRVPAVPSGLKKLGDREFDIQWSDGHASRYSFRYLRQNCQCALCVDEWTSRPILARESVAEDLKGMGASLVGQYALQFGFSDGHSTGIYTFDHLRKICPCETCVRGAKEPAPDKIYLEKQDLRKKA